MLLDYKISYILSKETNIFTKINTRLDSKLKLDGKADLNYVVLIKSILQLLSTSILTYNLRLELYKKLIHLLRFFGLFINPTDVANSNI